MVAFMQRVGTFLNMILSLKSNLAEAFPLAEWGKIESQEDWTFAGPLSSAELISTNKNGNRKKSSGAGLLSFTPMSEGENACIICTSKSLFMIALSKLAMP